MIQSYEMKLNKTLLNIFVAFFFIFAAFLPIIEYNNIDTTDKWSDWSGFFGSYLGGILGGCATLLAVVLTIKEENTSKAKKSTTIVYYDFKFAIKELIDIIITLGKDTITPDKNEIDISEILRTLKREDLMPKVKSELKQFYFDSDWIKTVADLCNSLEESKIKEIYQIYGDFLTIQKYVSGSDEQIDNAFTAIINIVETINPSGCAKAKVPSKHSEDNKNEYIEFTVNFTLNETEFRRKYRYSADLLAVLFEVKKYTQS